MQKNLSNLFKVYLLISTLLLSAGFIFLFQKVENQSLPRPQPTEVSSAPQEVTSNLGFICDSTCKDEIKKVVKDELSKSAPKSTVTTVTPTTTPPPTVTKQTNYIPFSGPITSTSTDWVDATGTDITMDLVNDYSKSAVTSWQATLKVSDGNGQAYARLFDVTHGIAVSGSEVSTVNNSDYQTISSGNFSLWAGRNTYRVQVKSLNSFVVTFGSGRMKIVY